MLKAIAFIAAVWIGLNVLGFSTPLFATPFETHGLGGFAEGLIAAGLALVAAILVLGVVFYVVAGLLVLAVAAPVFIIALVVFALVAPVLLPFLILAAVCMLFFGLLGGVFA